MIDGFNQVELGFVLVVVIADISVGNVDLGVDLLVIDLVNGQAAPYFALQFIQGQVLLFELALKLLFGAGGLEFIDLAFHFFIGSKQAQLLGALQDDLFADHRLHNAQLQAFSLGALGLVCRSGELLLVIAVKVRAQQFLAVDAGDDVAPVGT